MTCSGSRPAPPRETLPRPRRISATESHHLAPALGDGFRGGILSWDGQLEDDARLVTTIARTAAGLGAEVRTRARAVELHGTGAVLRDELTGESRNVSARAVVNAAGVWAGDLVDDVELRPSRGTHLVLRAEALPGLGVALTLPVPGERTSFVTVVPQQDGLVYVGLTDVPVEGRRTRRPRAERVRDRVPAGHHVRGPGPSAHPRRCRRRVRRAPAPPPLRRTHRGPVSPARGPHLAIRRRHDRGRQAHDVPPDGAGRHRRRRQALRGSTPGPARPRDSPCSGRRRAPELARLALESPSPRLVRRFGTDASLVVDDRPPGLRSGRRRPARTGRRGSAGDARRARVRGHPRGCPRRRRPARPAHADRSGVDRPGKIRDGRRGVHSTSRRQRFVKLALGPSPSGPRGPTF